MSFHRLQTSFEPQRPDFANRAENLAFAMERVAMMLDCFPERTNTTNAGGHAAGLAAILSDYPREVIVALTDPRTGMQVRQKFPPLPYELRQAAEAEMAPRRREQERRVRIEETQRMLSAPREEKPTGEEIKAKYGKTYGLDAPSARGAVKTPRKTLAQLQAEASEPIPIGEALLAHVAERASRQQNPESY